MTADKDPAMSDIETYGCAHCFAAVYHPTVEEERHGICAPCHRRVRERAYQELRALDEQHADVLDDI